MLLAWKFIHCSVSAPVLRMAWESPMRQTTATGPRKACGPAVDRELRFAVEDDEHLLDRVVKVVADTAPGGNLATVQEVEMGADRARA